MSSKKGFFCMNTLKQFDAFAKPLEEVQIKTVWGGIVSLVCFLTIVFLMVSNLVEYLDNTPTEELFVDTSRNKKLQINFDIVVPKISCDFLVLDAVDNSGETHLQVDHNIYKRRLNLEGQPISDPEKSDDVGSKKTLNPPSMLKSNETDDANNTEDICGSCYGAESSTIPCCNTCDDVKRAYKMKNWDFRPSSIEQCKNQSSQNEMYDKAFKEGCQLYGTLLVNRVSGSFHIAPGMSFSFNHMHVHDVHPFSSSSFNTTHTIRHLSFGQKLESINTSHGGNPLDSTESIAGEGATMFQYYIKIVPTLYQRRDLSIFSTNQFSVTKHKVQAFDKGPSGAPGIFFSYEFSPIMIKLTEKPRLLGHLFTQFLCNISGVFICFWIIDIFMYKVSKVYNIRKKQLPNSNN
ncbi:endoplasmic reticulum-Golgi intermediate compartment protein 3 [Acyrthosiphon pisum]|uniref:Endoplasmic reticulum-Golgi intermediate compartment protein 3 n=2 Tax=Macrosiphini TaxID=33386 RepID=A0A8R1W1Z8_ACYPI|nr:endoplasmic reticulum-Golgi intermediate compartment protein 3 [Acyrthosiphon pisum]|eukprot:XP_001948436.1 PREDICTED: endoplasmic reticulum-Golgi intermediate compartment protein 3 [Acyrthosiphon pisum]